MQYSPSMARVRSAFVGLAGALLFGCGSSASLEFASGGPSIVDSGDPNPYPDSATTDPDAPKADGLIADAGPEPKCAAGKDGKGNVCVRVVRAAEGPSISADTKTMFGLDGHGAVLIGLASVKPSARGEVAFVAQTWFPTESSGAGKLAASELPKVAEIAVPAGTYWAFAMFRDQEPFMRPGLTIGDYVPRMAELPQVTVGEGAGANVDVKLYPVRGVDVEVRVTTSAAGSGAGPSRFWMVDETKKIVGEGGASCLDLSGGKTEVVRLFTTYTGTFGVAGALFDFSPAGDDGSGSVPSLPPGTLYDDPSGNYVKITEGDWIAPTKKRVDLDKLVPLSGLKPADPSLNCASDPYIAPK